MTSVEDPSTLPLWLWPRAAYVHIPFCAHHCGYCDFAIATGQDHTIELYLDALAKELTELTAAARTRRIAPEALRGATISLSNFGALGGLFAALVVVPPQVAILGAGRIHPRVTSIDGRLTTTQVLPLSLTFDHRVVSGGEAARFLAAVKVSLERTA